MSLTEIVNTAIDDFCLRMNEKKPVLKDAVASIRIIGEFSAGKTRLIRELLGNMVPVCLLPVSSMERQTYLPLEITYGDTPRLTLIERSGDTMTAKEVSVLDKFPERTQLKNDGLKQGVHRLRLEVPEKRLILPEGDGYFEGSQPVRFSLIDMPGWNSGESTFEENAEDDMVGELNLALVYVTDALRIDSGNNPKNLTKFLEKYREASFIDDCMKTLYFLITHCPLREQNKFVTQVEERIRSMLTELGEDLSQYMLVVRAVDFSDMSSDDKSQFSHDFWSTINKPVTEIKFDWADSISRWPSEWDIGRRLGSIGKMLDNAQSLLASVKTKGKYISNWNPTRQKAYKSPLEREQKVLSEWQKQLSVNIPILLSTENIKLPYDHPLSTWWNSYLTDGLQKIVTPIEIFFAKEEKLLRELPEDIDDFEKYLGSRLDKDYLMIEKLLQSSFAIMCRSAASLSKKTKPEVVATVLALSQIDARYTDHLNGVA